MREVPPPSNIRLVRWWLGVTKRTTLQKLGNDDQGKKSLIAQSPGYAQ